MGAMATSIMSRNGPVSFTSTNATAKAPAGARITRRPLRPEPEARARVETAGPSAGRMPTGDCRAFDQLGGGRCLSHGAANWQIFNSSSIRQPSTHYTLIATSMYQGPASQGRAAVREEACREALEVEEESLHAESQDHVTC